MPVHRFAPILSGLIKKFNINRYAYIQTRFMPVHRFAPILSGLIKM